MGPLINRIGNALGWCGAAVLVAVALPFLALTVLVLRTVFVAVAVVALLGAIGLFCVHSPFRAWMARHARA